jgi:hypothetical protein
MKWLLEKTTSAYAIFVSVALMCGSILGAVMTLLEDHIIVVAPTPSSVHPTSPSPAKNMVAASTPSSSSVPIPTCANQGQSREIIAFLLFGCK